jgi:predicted TIM-barrel fold metal-dependent hydrolase
MRELTKRGARGFRLRHWRDERAAARMWGLGADRELVMELQIRPGFFEEVDRMCRRFPATRVVIEHMAMIGAEDATPDLSDVEALCGLARHKRLAVKLSGFYALGHKAPPHFELLPMIRRLYEAFGPRRLMWGSDAPYQTLAGNNYASSLALIRDHLDVAGEEEKAWILRRTAERMFFP